MSSATISSTFLVIGVACREQHARGRHTQPEHAEARYRLAPVEQTAVPTRADAVGGYALQPPIRLDLAANAC